MSTLSRPTRLVITLMVWAGAMVMLYAPMATWFMQLEQDRATDELAGTMRTITSAERTHLLERAREYNDALLYGVGPEELDYKSILTVGGTDIMARLRIPSISLDQPIRHGMSEDVLSRALGHVEGTSLPVGGPSTNSVIGGHRGLATATAFTHLDDVTVGDEVIVEVAGEVLTYEAVSYEVLPPGDAEHQPVQRGRDLLTLITCTPLGMNTDRIVVVAERVETPAGAVTGERSRALGFPWWAVAAGVGTVAAVVVVAVPTKPVAAPGGVAGVGRRRPAHRADVLSRWWRRGDCLPTPSSTGG